GLITASYQTANPAKKWQFDYTLQINGGGRLPDPDASKPLWATTFKPYVINHMQVSKYFKSWSVYLGAENLFNFTQQNPIVDAENPFGDNFDATMIWGPVHGRTIYAGIRWNLFRD
ncbi:MAG: TonB-dependent receptor, partial [Tannerellaceae bacterium]